jgi:hypothetical protein
LLALRESVKQLNKNWRLRMAMEKKSLISKKATTPSKSKSTKSKVDTAKPAASKVVAARDLPGRAT